MESTVDLWCPFVAGGWSARELPLGLGGSEECLVLWAEGLAQRGHRVRVYHNPPGGSQGGSWGGCEEDVRGGVRYLPHHRFNPHELRDVLVSWKSPRPWVLGARARRCIHWSAGVERPWPRQVLARLDAFVTLSAHHRDQLPWLSPPLARVVPHGVDLMPLEFFRRKTVPGRALYIGVPQDGLVTLLRDWPRLRLEHAGLTLEVLCNWRRFRAGSKDHPQARAFCDGVRRLLEQEGIVFCEQGPRPDAAAAYWEAQYWVQPLLDEDELFCRHAPRALHCGALPVVHPRGALGAEALGDAVPCWMDYGDFRRGVKTSQFGATQFGAPQFGQFGETRPSQQLSWQAVIGQCWEPLFQDGFPGR